MIFLYRARIIGSKLVAITKPTCMWPLQNRAFSQNGKAGATYEFVLFFG